PLTMRAFIRPIAKSIHTSSPPSGASCPNRDEGHHCADGRNGIGRIDWHIPGRVLMKQNGIGFTVLQWSVDGRRLTKSMLRHPITSLLVRSLVLSYDHEQPSLSAESGF